jgi:antimicrobial peptide system SdpA family protein
LTNFNSINKKEPIRNGFFFIAFILLLISWVCILTLVTAVHIPYNPFTPSTSIKRTIMAIFPQGWSFFTKSPREEIFYVYTYDENDSCRLTELDLNNSSKKNLFGIKRYARTSSAEIAYLVKKIPTEYWIRTKSGINSINTDSLKPVFILNNTNSRLLCANEIIIEKKEPIPWAWSKSNPTRKSDLIKLLVYCP